MTLNPGPLEARAGCTQPSPRWGQCRQCALGVPDARGGDVVQGNTGVFSALDSHQEGGSHRRGLQKHRIQNPGQVRGRSAAAWATRRGPSGLQAHPSALT